MRRTVAAALAAGVWSLAPAARAVRVTPVDNLPCPLDPTALTGGVTIDYEGVVSADRIVATSRTEFGAQPVPGALSPEEQRALAAGAALMEMVGIQITAIRAGDCG